MKLSFPVCYCIPNTEHTQILQNSLHNPVCMVVTADKATCKCCGTT